MPLYLIFETPVSSRYDSPRYYEDYVRTLESDGYEVYGYFDPRPNDDTDYFHRLTEYYVLARRPFDSVDRSEWDGGHMYLHIDPPDDIESATRIVESAGLVVTDAFHYRREVSRSGQTEIYERDCLRVVPRRS